MHEANLDSRARTSHIVGSAILNGSGRVAYVTGIASDSAVAACFTDPDWLSRARERRLYPLEVGNKTYVALLTPLASGDLLVLSESEHPAVFEFLSSVDFAYDIINFLITDRSEAMVVVNRDAKISYFSPVNEHFFGLVHGGARGRPIGDLVEGSRIVDVMRTGKADVGIYSKMKGQERVITRMPIPRDGKVVGAISRVMFTNTRQVEDLHRRLSEFNDEGPARDPGVPSVPVRVHGIDDMVGNSAVMKRMKSLIAKAASVDMPVLIMGESGTGKELVAHALHSLSPRKAGELVLVNAAAIPAELVESELFGYESGAFTGASRKGRKGKFESAHGGTIFMDEIGDMPMETQAKLLRVIQDRLVQRVGSERPRAVDFRLISATNCDLLAMTAERRFRLDLYYRLAPIVIEVPPLRERREDIPLLLEKFLSELSARHGNAKVEFSSDTIDYLCQQDWPGNVRQLRYEVERAFVFREADCITADDLRGALPAAQEPHPLAPVEPPDPEARGLRKILATLEEDAIWQAMKKHRGNKKKAAQELGISRSHLYKRLGAASS